MWHEVYENDLSCLTPFVQACTYTTVSTISKFHLTHTIYIILANLHHLSYTVSWEWGVTEKERFDFNSSSISIGTCGHGGGNNESDFDSLAENIEEDVDWSSVPAGT